MDLIFDNKKAIKTKYKLNQNHILKNKLLLP